jgi:hypothetical protein
MENALRQAKEKVARFLAERRKYQKQVFGPRRSRSGPMLRAMQEMKSSAECSDLEKSDDGD